MSSYSSKAQPFLDAIAAAAFTDGRVRNWIIAGTRHEDRYAFAVSLHELQKEYRPGTKQPFYVNYWCGRDKRCTCRIEGSSSLETDLMLLFMAPTGRRLGVHVEFKHPKEALSHGQAQGYPLRAECWRGGGYRPGTVAPYDDWLTVIFCADQELESPALAPFDRRIGHGEVRGIVPGYPGGEG